MSDSLSDRLFPFQRAGVRFGGKDSAGAFAFYAGPSNFVGDCLVFAEGMCRISHRHNSGLFQAFLLKTCLFGGLLFLLRGCAGYICAYLTDKIVNWSKHFLLRTCHGWWSAVLAEGTCRISHKTVDWFKHLC